MKIAIIQGSSQREKNKMLEECVSIHIRTRERYKGGKGDL